MGVRHFKASTKSIEGGFELQNTQLNIVRIGGNSAKLYISSYKPIALAVRSLQLLLAWLQILFLPEQQNLIWSERWEVR